MGNNRGNSSANRARARMAATGELWSIAARRANTDRSFTSQMTRTQND